MTDDMHLTSKQWQLLSAYLDDEQPERVREQVRSMLESNPEAARALQSLRITKSLLQTLPELKVPHQYTLTRQEALAARPNWLVKGLRAMSGISAALLAAILAVDLFLPTLAVPQSARMESLSADEAPMMESLPAQKQEETIQPFNFEPAPPGMGLGGGGSPEEMPDGEPGVILPDISIVEGESLQEEPQADAITEEELTAESEDLESKAEQDTGPVLGVAPPDEQGIVVEQDTPRAFPQEPQPTETRTLSYQTLEIALLAASLFTAIAAIIIRRKQRVKQ